MEYLPQSKREWITVAIASAIVAIMVIGLFVVLKPMPPINNQADALGAYEPPPIWANIGEAGVVADDEVSYDYILLETTDQSTGNRYYMAMHKEPDVGDSVHPQIAVFGSEPAKDGDQRQGTYIQQADNGDPITIALKLPEREAPQTESEKN